MLVGRLLLLLAVWLLLIGTVLAEYALGGDNGGYALVQAAVLDQGAETNHGETYAWNQNYVVLGNPSGTDNSECLYICLYPICTSVLPVLHVWVSPEMPAPPSSSSASREPFFEFFPLMGSVPPGMGIAGNKRLSVGHNEVMMNSFRTKEVMLCRLHSDMSVSAEAVAGMDSEDVLFYHGGRVYFYDVKEVRRMRIVSLDNHTPVLHECPDWPRFWGSEQKGEDEQYETCWMTPFQLSGCLFFTGSGNLGKYATFVLDTDNEAAGWVRMRCPTPTLGFHHSNVAVVNETAYCFGRRGLVRFSLREGWSEVESVPALCRNVCGMYPVGSLIVGLTQSRFVGGMPQLEIVAYDTISGEWQQWGESPGYRMYCHMDPSHTLVLRRSDGKTDDTHRHMLAVLDPALLYPHCGMRWAGVAPNRVLGTQLDGGQ
ncbi:hypothetical protein KIPB_003099 [Kipferlia bialata]|uniref:Uncharacterized protein n=1 Tax=Kipferlia bialata TaxID=797122 RepID=A0A9K3CTF3_9EUKA|nr:hypothetical protein KIPB_003099 [Kipferlia bialata]|eukprot:g3099.t1